MLVRLRYLSHDLEVPLGQFVIGRSAECQLSLEDPLVSRRHALLTVRRDGVTIEDLGSRNGVLLNGRRIEGQEPVAHRDQITVGSQEMTLELSMSLPADAFEDPSHTTMRRSEVDLGDRESLTHVGEAPPALYPDKRVNALSLIGGVADKAFALGRVEEAKRILQRSLIEILDKARRGDPIEPELADRAAQYATKLAAATVDGAWIDFVFELYTLRNSVLPGSVVDELYNVVRRVRVDRRILRAYVARLAEETDRRGPAERFLQQRIEGLERLGALK
jgi:hypothetical protein